ncbi:MAG TPA: TlpA family protein disulfide reductase [Candidatus Coprenecus pullistercoris]|nr:TlpA family protein disulfide reductase [Candidatus Coprenecus pullistercoris]
MAAASCSDKDAAGVSLSVDGAPDSSMAVVSRLAVNRLEVLDTLWLISGKAETDVPVVPGSPEFVYIACGHGPDVPLLLKAGDRVSVSCGWNSGAEVSVEGSPESVLLGQVDSAVRAFNEAFDSLSAVISEKSSSGDGAGELKARRELGALYVARKQEALRYILSNPYSMTVVPVLYQETPEGQRIFDEAMDAVVMKRAYDSLMTVYPSSPYLAAVADDIETRLRLMEMDRLMADAGEMDFPEISLGDINGRTQSLSSLKGQVVVLLFWDSSDPEQRMYNTALKGLYERCHDSGLEVYQVALTADKAAWAMQVREQQLPWISVCDQAGTSSVLYNVQRLPAMYVISRDGEITARDMFDMNSLSAEVNRLL